MIILPERSGPRNGVLAFLSILAYLSMGAVLPSIGATLTFQRSTDVLGFASVFEAGVGLPSRNFTLSVTVRSSSGRDDFILVQALDDIFLVSQFGPHLELLFDTQSIYIDGLPNNQSAVDELMLSMRTWTLTYNDASLMISLYVDAVYIGAESLARPPFPGESIFGGAVRSLLFGPHSLLEYDTEGTPASLLPAETNSGLFGQLDGMQLWDHALNSSEIARTAALPSSLAGDEEGLCIFWRADQGYGVRVPNLGSTGAQYDGLLGYYAVGRYQTSSAWGTDCYGAASTTSPAWLNRSAENNVPIADNMTKSVSPDRDWT